RSILVHEMRIALRPLCCDSQHDHSRLHLFSKKEPGEERSRIKRCKCKWYLASHPTVSFGGRSVLVQPFDVRDDRKTSRQSKDSFFLIPSTVQGGSQTMVNIIQ